VTMIDRSVPEFPPARGEWSPCKHCWTLQPYQSAVCDSCYNVTVGWAECPTEALVSIMAELRPDALAVIHHRMAKVNKQLTEFRKTC